MKSTLSLLLLAAAAWFWPGVPEANARTAADSVRTERSELVFPLQQEHAHGATLVELANGSLLAAWFQGHGERWADDVRIMGARLPKGKEPWGKPFVLADVPDFPDIHAIYSLHKKDGQGESIKHAAFDEAWIVAGD